MKDEVTLTFTGIYVRDGKKLVPIRFERKRDDRVDFAEGSVPSCRIDTAFGFSKDEVAQLEACLLEQKYEIMTRAKEINHITRLL